MSMAEMLMAEFTRESDTTRKFLDRVPEEKLGWKPHEKSLTAGQLALHMAAGPGNVIQLASQPAADLPDFGKPFAQPSKKAEIMQAFDESVAAVKKILPTITDEGMKEMWQARRAGAVAFELPRYAFIRNILFNHFYHHRGQLGVYLRLVGAQVPSAYGPSGDEVPEGFKPKAH